MQSLLLNSIEYRKQIESQLFKSTKVSILTAYLTSPGVKWLLSHLSDSAFVQVVGRFDVNDFINGASDYAALRTLLNAGHDVRISPHLHAKLLMLDHAKVYLGSANLTAKGLGLIPNHNFEIGICVESSEVDTDFVLKAIENSFKLDLDLVDLMEQHSASFESAIVAPISLDWPKDLFLVTPYELFVKDLPSSPPGKYSEVDSWQLDTDFLEIYRLKDDFDAAKLAFQKTKSYRWLVSLLSKEGTEEGLSFGDVTARLHLALIDDPAPYRRTVKGLQVNLYEYCRLYCRDVIEFHKPGSRSEFIKLRSSYHSQ